MLVNLDLTCTSASPDPKLQLAQNDLIEEIINKQRRENIKLLH